ncbi:YopJ/P [Candidatus Regiella insecticola 5.15]|uniref:YopJ/P n=1 Tax=Candidatus Regiella insecticola 5.15 TaxID=1005043 RepID=G2GZ67_9ENTR|nr:YopJ family acetyltransferase [Candidatus Regiella insecticola]EGY28958.1 YopJ/P [Candidatus Regiella insecticola 5.15]
MIQRFDKIKRLLDRGDPFCFTDTPFLPDIITDQNLKKPGLNATFCDSTEFFATELAKLVAQKNPSARFVVKTNSLARHYCAFDYRLINGKVSVIGVESTSFMPVSIKGALNPTIVNLNRYSAQLLLINAKESLKKAVGEHTFIMLPINIQNSPHGCGIFCVSFISKMFKEKKIFDALHEKNIAGLLPSTGFQSDGLQYDYIVPEVARTLLPLSFLKHIQSPNSLAECITLIGGDAGTASVNKQNQTLVARQKCHLIVMTDIKNREIAYSNSIDKKRRDYYKALVERQLFQVKLSLHDEIRAAGVARSLGANISEAVAGIEKLSTPTKYETRFKNGYSKCWVSK